MLRRQDVIILSSHISDNASVTRSAGPVGPKYLSTSNMYIQKHKYSNYLIVILSTLQDRMSKRAWLFHTFQVSVQRRITKYHRCPHIAPATETPYENRMLAERPARSRSQRCKCFVC